MPKSSTASTPKKVCKHTKDSVYITKVMYVAKGKYIEYTKDIVYIAKGKYGKYVTGGCIRGGGPK
jgi:hypothetical protein